MSQYNLTPEMIKLIRQYHGLTLHEVAVGTGYSLTWVHQVEAGQAPISDTFARRLKKLFKLNDGKVRKIAIILGIFDEVCRRRDDERP